MFTGIIEDLGTVVSIETDGDNVHLTCESKITPELKIDQSVAHNGVCLTVVAINGNQYVVTAIKETLDKTNLEDLCVGDIINLERCLAIGDRIDGHMVYGHVDTVGKCKSITEEKGSWVYEINFPEESSHLIVEKGSIALNGTSLTVFNVKNDSFSVAIIPYTFDHTSIKNIGVGDRLNLEFDIFGKYVEKHLNKIR